MDSQQFHSSLHALTELDPGNLLLRKFQREGFTPINALLIQQQLDKAEAHRPADQLEGEAEEVDYEETPDPVDDSTLRTLRTKLRKLFSDRNRLSDRFYQLKTVKDRAFNSEEVQLVQKNIGRTMQAIRHYKIHGELPAEAMRHYIPQDGVELVKKQNSLRANISREKKIIRQLREQVQQHPDDAARARQIEKRIDRLAELKTDLKNVTEAIKDLRHTGVQEGQ